MLKAVKVSARQQRAHLQARARKRMLEPKRDARSGRATRYEHLCPHAAPHPGEEAPSGQGRGDDLGALEVTPGAPASAVSLGPKFGAPSGRLEARHEALHEHAAVRWRRSGDEQEPMI